MRLPHVFPIINAKNLIWHYSPLYYTTIGEFYMSINKSDLPRSVDATAYLSSDLFVTEYDILPVFSGRDYAKEQYEKGLKIGKEAIRVWIAYNGTWGAMYPNGGNHSSYEVIGNHRNTKELLQGFLDSDVPFYVYQEFMSHPPLFGEPDLGIRIK